MPKLIFQSQETPSEEDKAFELEAGENIGFFCEEYGGACIACSEGICGSCMIDVAEGMENLSPFTEAEQDFLDPEGTSRLSCQCSIQSGTVRILV